MSERPYVKVYREIIADDPKFETIYPSNRNLATWLRMLLLADAMYPAPAPVAGFNRRAVADLVTCGLVELVGSHHYRFHGLKSERSIQSDAGKAGAAARWGRIAGHEIALCDPMPTNPTEPSPTETNPTQPAGEPALDAYQCLYPTVSANALRFLDELIAEFGQEPTARAIGQASLKGRDKLLSRAKTILVLSARNTERAEERKRVAAKRAPVVRQPAVEETPEQREIREAKWAEVQKQLAQIGLRPKKETE